MTGHYLLKTRIRHRRLTPIQNLFSYSAYHVSLNMNNLKQETSRWWFGINKHGLNSFHDKDHGQRNGKCSLNWAYELLKEYRILGITEIQLITMPRVMGYLFNPVSFWCCYDAKHQLIAVIVEVNNTFGETHSYVCYHSDGREIKPADWLQADKQFHVSPFMDRDGYYRFRFLLSAETVKIAIHYYVDNAPKLITSLTASVHSFSKMQLLKQSLASPIMTLKVTLLIHWQALKLWWRKMRYRCLPVQKQPKHSSSK